MHYKTIAILIGLLGITYFATRSDEIDFNTQVKPIINKKCIACHGGVKQQGGFSLLFREEALAKTKSGKYAIIPGDANGSELIRRIKSDDPEERMPYEHEKLSPEEIKIFESWIDQGAKWGIHWAYLPVTAPKIPNKNDTWVSNDIDRFILDKLDEQGLPHNEVADKSTLLRRISLDVIGMPASTTITDTYLKSDKDDAYKILIDSLLASPRYGEKWASMWLDLARYADSKGYESDSYRNIWQYRDWLIKAFNKDMPYDQFLTQQFAGDLIKDSDVNILLGTAFHRNTMTNDEGGTQNEEYRVAAVMDRVNTTWSALMGTSFNCVQCHSHPYDPIRHEEYYKFMAYFNNDADEDLSNEYPTVKMYKGRDSIHYLRLMDWVSKYGPTDRKYFEEMLLNVYPRYNINNTFYTNAHSHIGNNEGIFRNGGTIGFSNIKMDAENFMMLVYLYADGKFDLYYDSLNTKPFKTLHFKKSGNLQFVKFPVEKTNQVKNIYLKYTAKTNIKEQTGATFSWMKVGKSLPGKGQLGYAEVNNLVDSLMISWADGTPVLKERIGHTRRKTYMFERGNWTTPTTEVNPGTPQFMNAFDKSFPQNRYGLSQWLTDSKNPLVARTMVNRVWEQLFGRGLVETLEDLGTQGSLPSHRELLDHLSYQFMHEYKWSIKRLIAEIVSSSTYRQSSSINSEVSAKDPNNIYLSRGPRIRLTAEQIRDQNLAFSDLISYKMYGKSVMPHQPKGIWSSPYNGELWITSSDGNQYRRSVYTHIKRTALYPTFATFDVGSREVCNMRRINSNTPLQALNTLNDTTYIIAARNIAQKLNTTIPFDKNVKALFQKMFYKDIGPKQVATLQNLYMKTYNHYKNKRQAASQLLAVAESETNTIDKAAWVVTINAMMNMDEWLTKN